MSENFKLYSFNNQYNMEINYEYRYENHVNNESSYKLTLESTTFGNTIIKSIRVISVDHNIFKLDISMANIHDLVAPNFVSLILTMTLTS